MASFGCEMLRDSRITGRPKGIREAQSYAELCSAAFQGCENPVDFLDCWDTIRAC